MIICNNNNLYSTLFAVTILMVSFFQSEALYSQDKNLEESNFTNSPWLITGDDGNYSKYIGFGKNVFAFKSTKEEPWRIESGTWHIENGRLILDWNTGIVYRFNIADSDNRKFEGIKYNHRDEPGDLYFLEPLKFKSPEHEQYSVGIPLVGAEFILDPGTSETHQFSLPSPDGSAKVVVKASLDRDVLTWQGYKRYASDDVRTTYGSNAGRLRVTVEIDGIQVLQLELKGEQIADLGRNRTTWVIPKFNTPEEASSWFNWNEFVVQYKLGSSGSRWDKDDGSLYPKGRIEKVFLIFNYIRKEL